MNKELEEDDKRNFSRVDAYLPLTYRLVPKEEHFYIQSEMIDRFYMDTFSTFPEITDQTLSTCLSILNAKLDKILYLLTIRKEDLHSPSPRLVNISGAGLRFTASKKFEDGDIIEVIIHLNVLKYRTFKLYGKIICIEEIPEGYLTSLSFIQIDDSVRDEIIKFVFEREREILREKRGDIT